MDLINDLCQKTGIEQRQAEKVVRYLKDNVTRLPQLINEARLGSGTAGTDMRPGETHRR